MGDKQALGALEWAYCKQCKQRRVFIRTQNGSWFTWSCERCGERMEK